MVTYVPGTNVSLLNAKTIWNGDSPGYIGGVAGIAKMSEFRGLPFYQVALGPDNGPFEFALTGAYGIMDGPTNDASRVGIAGTSPIADNIN
jgi:hypothetical protein